MSYHSHEQERVHNGVYDTPANSVGYADDVANEPDSIESLIDDLESLVVNARRVPLSQMLLINQDVLLDFVDRMRAAVPYEVLQAQRVLHQQQQIIEHAQAQAFQLLQERGLMQRLETERQKVVATADRDAERTRAEADKYARDVLIQLQQRLEHIQSSVQHGIATLDPVHDEA